MEPQQTVRVDTGGDYVEEVVDDPKEEKENVDRNYYGNNGDDACQEYFFDFRLHQVIQIFLTKFISIFNSK